METVYRYALDPSYVISASDRQRHYIGARALAFLYGVPLRDCLVIPFEYGILRDQALAHAKAFGLQTLVPRDDGNYSLPR